MSDNTDAMAVVQPQAALQQSGGGGDLFDPNGFNHLMRLAKMFAASPLVPEHLRKGGPEQSIANCAICLSMARELGENPIVVMNNIHIVNGKFGWSSSYMIARANQSGKFKTPINWRVTGKGETLTVVAYATTKGGDVVESVAVTMAMAKAEGWTKNPKYISMGEVMLRYRSAAFLIRMYAPETTLGYHTADELESIPAEPVTARVVSPSASRNPLAAVIMPELKDPTPPPASASNPMAAEVLAVAGRLMERTKGVMPDWLPDSDQIADLDDARLSALLDKLHAALDGEATL